MKGMQQRLIHQESIAFDKLANLFFVEHISEC